MELLEGRQFEERTEGENRQLYDIRRVRIRTAPKEDILVSRGTVTHQTCEIDAAKDRAVSLLGIFGPGIWVGVAGGRASASPP
jgi:hypothetical protein